MRFPIVLVGYPCQSCQSPVVMSAHVDNREERSSACEGLGDEGDALGLAVNGIFFLK